MAIKRKLRSRKGFTLAETLLAVLILLLVSMIVANGVPVARNVYQKVMLSANAQDLLATAVSALRDELGTGWGVEKPVGGDGTTIVYYSADTGARSKIYVGTDAGTNQIMLQENVAVEGLGIDNNSQSKGRALVSDKGMANESRLFVSYTSVAYAPTTHVVTFTGLQAGTKQNPALAKLDKLEILVFMDKEIN